MNHVAHNTAMRSAQLAHDNRCDCCGHDPDPDGEREDQLREAMKSHKGFITEALANIEPTDLVAAYLSGEAQATQDALADLVGDYLRERIKFQLQRTDVFARDYPRSDLDALENIARVWQVAA